MATKKTETNEEVKETKTTKPKETKKPEETVKETPKEEEIASYSTKLGGSTENRLTNIKITCNKNF